MPTVKVTPLGKAVGKQTKLCLFTESGKQPPRLAMGACSKEVVEWFLCTYHDYVDRIKWNVAVGTEDYAYRCIC